MVVDADERLGSVRMSRVDRGCLEMRCNQKEIKAVRGYIELRGLNHPR